MSIIARLQKRLVKLEAHGKRCRANVHEMTDMELARRIAFVYTEAMRSRSGDEHFVFQKSDIDPAIKFMLSGRLPDRD